MAEGWDLQAVVRGCSAAVNNTTNTTNFNTNMINNNGSNMQPLGDPLYEFASLAVQTQEDPFCFPNLFEKRNNNPFEELEQIYNPFFTTNIAPEFTPISDLGGFQDQQQLIQQQQLQQPQQPQPQQQQQQQQLQQIQFQKPRAAQTIGPPRPRRRKNQQARMVCQVTAECLSSDLWAWRKYGQKPIKGSPYPRNYYRCSSSKGCGARKQVERNAMDPNMFIVSYTGDHTHPRPTHRNSLAGSTRNKFSAPQISNSGDPQQLPIEKPSFSSPSPISTSSLSPTTPLSAPMDDELAAHQHEDKDAGIEEEENEEEMADFDIDDDDDILIPNMVMSEDIFMGFQELGGGLPGSFQANSDSPWAPNSSATNTSTNVAGGSGC